MRAFHVDRTERLSEKTVLDVQKFVPAGPTHAIAVARLDTLFPEGLSPFGAHQLFGREFLNADGNTDQEIELIFELTRRLMFPGRPSRLTSYFGSESIEEARLLRDGWSQETGRPGRIWEVEANTFFRGDGSLLTLDGTGWDVLERSRAYWGGEESARPEWELLLMPLVRVIAEVT